MEKLYDEYVKNHKDIPKSFDDFIRIYNRVIFHKTYIRSQIIWWNELNRNKI